MAMSSTPEAFMASMLQANPAMKEVGDAVQRNNGNYQAAFYDLAKSKGVNPSQIINAVKGMM